MPVREGGRYIQDVATGETVRAPEQFDDLNTREGRSGTAREAPSTDGGTTEDRATDASSVEAQPAAPTPDSEPVAYAPDADSASRRRSSKSDA